MEYDYSQMMCAHVHCMHTHILCVNVIQYTIIPGRVLHTVHTVGLGCANENLQKCGFVYSMLATSWCTNFIIKTIYNPLNIENLFFCLF